MNIEVYHYTHDNTWLVMQVNSANWLDNLGDWGINAILDEDARFNSRRDAIRALKQKCPNAKLAKKSGNSTTFEVVSI